MLERKYADIRIQFFLLALVSCLAIGGSFPSAAQTPSAPSWSVERDRAVNMARDGDAAGGLAILERLRRDHPNQTQIIWDNIVVATWAGQEQDAINLYESYPASAYPDYVQEAVGLAYRRQGQAPKALLLYRQALRQTPGNAVFKAGEIRSLVDIGQAKQAIILADADVKAHGDRAKVLLAAAYGSSALKMPVEALRYIERAIKRDPKDPEALHDRILAISAMGAPHLSLRFADESPDVISAAERRRIEGDAAAALVRWGVFEPASEGTRFDATDRAIAALDELILRWSKQGDAAKADVLRARFDRMVAYRDRVRMDDVLREYEELSHQNTPIPGYALIAAGDAYLYRRQPEKALDLFLKALESDPKNFNTRMAIFYAYVEMDDFDKAYQEVDSATADQEIWHKLNGLVDPIENPQRANGDLTSAQARLYAGDLNEAHRRIAGIVQAAPNNSTHLTALADIYSARGWPRTASQEYEISRSLKPLDVATEVGQALNNLQLRNYRLVEAQLADLMRRFPENLRVQRLDRLWKVHNMAELRVNVEKALPSSGGTQGSGGLSVETQIYTPPINYNWRLFAAESLYREKLPAGEGKIALRRTALGGEYRGLDLIASLEGTMNAQNTDTSDALGASLGSGRAGARALASWSNSDYWTFGGGGELFAHDTPLRALRQGVHANSIFANSIYRESELRKFQLDAKAMNFSDGNLRTSLGGQYTQRLLTRPRTIIDGTLGLAASHNSANTNRVYFNPKQDGLATAGVSIEQAIYRRYEFVYDHHLVVTPGIYWEKGYGAKPVVNLMYEHRIKSDDVVEAALGFSFARHLYDGHYENAMAVLFNLRYRF